MPGSSKRPSPKRHDRYHHGDLRRALVDETVRVIQAQGVEAVTLRAVGASLGVSRTALYRHFSDKGALLAAVAAEGFRTFRAALVDAWDGAGRGLDGFTAMGQAYVHFALEHSSHYRVMFGGFLRAGECSEELTREGAAAFQVLVDALLELQAGGIVRRDDPQQLSLMVWATVHGVAMLAIDGQLGEAGPDLAGLTRFVLERLRGALAP